MTLKRIFIGCDIDDIYSFAEAYRLAKGDLFFRDIWEAQMTSAIIQSMLVKLWMFMTGTTTGVIIFVRVVSTIWLVFLTFFTYKTLTIIISNKKLCLSLSCLVYLYSTKKMIVPDYGNFQTWLPILLVLFFIRYYYKDTCRYYLVLSGLALSVLVLAYPTYIILTIAYAAGIIYMGKEIKNPRCQAVVRELLIWGSTCFVCGSLFIAYLLCHMTVVELIENIRCMMAASGYSISGGEKWAVYVQQFIKELKYWFVIGVTAVGATGILGFYYRRNRIEFGKEKAFMIFWSFFVTIDIIEEICRTIINNTDWNLRYIAILSIAGLVYTNKKREK